MPWPAVQHLPGHALGYLTDEEWSAQQVEDMPLKWAQRLLAAQRRKLDRQAGNLALLAGCRLIRQAMRAGVQPDAGDGQIRQEADESARDMARRLGLIQRAAPGRVQVPYSLEWVTLRDQVDEARRLLAGRGLLEHWPESKRIKPSGALARVQRPEWWRRVLRKVHAKAVENTARGLGLVHKRAGCYASEDTCRRRRGQVERNAAALESVAAVNDLGQQYTLAELAARGTANKAIRRQELMTRIAGFELIAKDCGHEAAFITLTCPGRMHAMRTMGQRVEANPRFDGTAPDAAQRYLSKQWARFRPAAERAGLELYGFRIAEPQHDGTPHWHMLLFFPKVLAGGRRTGRPHAWRVLVQLLRRYFWRNDSPDERGARRNRLDVVRIDWTKGSAAGYVAKYVAKNIDGMHVERDLLGNEAMAASQRVEAWASTWRVRQFQQIGGAPVTVWRELRRLNTEQAGAAPAVALMLDAVNITSQADQHESEAVRRHTAAHGWATYIGLQGGHRVRRKSLRVRLLKEQTGELNQFGELKPPRPIGVQTDDARREWVPMTLHPAGGWERSHVVRVEVESERREWICVPKSLAAGAIERMQEQQRSAAGASTWSPVNNCTAPGSRPAPLEGARLFAAPVERHRKRGRWNTWKTKDDGNHHQPHAGSPGQ